MLHGNSVSHYRAFPRARCNTIQHTSTQAHTYPCNTNVYKYNSCALFGLDYSDGLMSSIRYFTTNKINVTTSFSNKNAVVVTNISTLTGEMHHLEINIDFDSFVQSLIDWMEGGLIQNCFPELTPDEREFIVSGITADEWESRFGLV